MAVRTISTRLSLEGEAEYKRIMASINAELGKLGSELKLVESRFEGNANSMAALTAKGDVLQKIYNEQLKKLDQYVDRLLAAQEAEEKSAAAGRELAESIKAQKNVIADFEAALRNSTDGTAKFYDENGRLVRQVDNASDELQKLKDELLQMERAFEANARQQQQAANAANGYEKQINQAEIQLNKLNAEIKQNEQYLKEAAASTNRCATSIDQYGKQVKEVEAASGSAGSKSTAFFSALKSGWSVVAGVATAAIGLAKGIYGQIKEFGELADYYKQLSSETHLTTTELQEMKYIGDDVGVSLDTISGAIKRLINNMDTAKNGSGEAYEAFETLGVKFRDDVTGELRSSTEVFNEVIDALGHIANETERDAIAQDLLGKSATELNPLIEAGAIGLRQMADEAQRMGAIMSEETVDAFDRAGDRIAHYWQAFKAQIGEAIVAVADWLAGNKEATGDSIETLETLGEKIEGIKGAYESVYREAKKSLDKQVELWDDLSGAAGETFGGLKSSIDSQNRALENYTTNLYNLAYRNIEGIDKLVESLMDGSEKSMARAAALASASDDDLRRLIDRMQEAEDRKEGLARFFAELKTDTDAQLNQLYAGVKNTAAQELNASEEAARAAKDTMNGYISQTEEMIPKLEAAYRKAAKAANDAYRDTLDMHSPSRVAMAAAEDYFNGIILGAKKKMADVEAAFAESATNAHRTIQETMRDSAPAIVKNETAQQNSAAIIGESLSKALSEYSAGGRPIVINIQPSPVNVDGRTVAQITYDYNLEESFLRGNSSISR